MIEEEVHAEEIALPPPEDFAAHLRAMLERLKVSRVVLVDDLVLPPVDAAAIYALVLGNPAATGALQPVFPGLSLTVENDALADQLAAVIGSLDADGIAKVADALTQLSDKPDEARDILQLRRLIPENLDVVFLTPQEWVGQREARIAECTTDALTIFLFDQQLNVEGQGLGFESGSDIIKGFSQTETDGFGVRWFCGMLSHTLNKGDEVARWRELADEHGIGLQFFMPISKQNLDEASDFFHALYRTLINTYCESMKTLAENGLRKSLDEALRHFSGLDPIDFEHMIVKTSDSEGVSELDTMLRVYGILHRDKMKTEFLKQATFSKFSEAAMAMKRVADIRRNIPSEAHHRVLKLRAAELYESSELVNSYNDPLRNGDIFGVGASGAEILFVLIAQPCDVMVRSNGQRNRDNLFKVSVLAPIDFPVAGQAPIDRREDLGFDLPNYGPDGNLSGTVNFGKATVANLPVLDLCVLNHAGNCEIDPAKLKTEVPAIPTRAWEGRAVELAKLFEKISTKIEKERKNHKNGDVVAALLSDALMPRAAMSHAFKSIGTYDSGKFSYPIRRMGRVRDPHASSLLSAFSRYLGRDAREHNFSELQA